MSTRVPAFARTVRGVGATRHAGDVGAALELTDRELLIDGLGCPPALVATLRAVWHRLRARRTARN